MNDWLKAALARTWRLPLRVDRADLAVLLALVIIAVLIATFLVLADAVGEGSTMAFDQSVLLAFRTPGHPEIPLGPLWLQELARDITSLGSFAVLGLIFIAAVGYLLLSKRALFAAINQDRAD